MAVFASGGGSNLQALIDHFNPAPAPLARVELVIASRPGIGALERAERAGIASRVLDARETGAEELAGRMLRALDEHRIGWVVLAGWLQRIPAAVVARFAGRMLNIHPALLPGFGGAGMYGMRVHRAVLESGTRVSGATVHLVNERYDEGRIVAQWPVPVLPGDTPESLAARVLAVEHRILPAAVELLVSEGVAAGQTDGSLCFDLADIPAPPAASVWRTSLRPDTDE